MPRHLPSRRGVSGHLPSERSACLTDAECQGRCRPDEGCQGICLLNAARVLQTQNVKANVSWIDVNEDGGEAAGGGKDDSKYDAA